MAPLLQSLHLWSLGFILFIALANLGFGLYSGALFLRLRRQPRPPLWPVALLVAGNGVWAIQCLFQAWRLRGESSGFGLAHLIFEAAYVGTAACFEARVFFFQAEPVQGLASSES